KGVSFYDILKLFFLLFPSFLIFTIPISLLVSILIGLGRLSSDNEITIFKASGVSLYQMLYPVALAALIAFVLTTITTFYLVPQSKFATKNLLFTVAKKKASVGIREKVFNDDFKGILLYAESIPVHGSYMEGVIISDTRIIKEPSTIIAKKAYLVSDPKLMTITLRLENGSTHIVDPKMKNYRRMDFRFYDVNLDSESSVAEEHKLKTKSSSELTIWEISEKLKSGGLDKNVLRELAVEMNKNIALPISCIVMGILGIPLGIRSHRAVRSRGFTIGLIIVLIYYFLILGGETLTETSGLPPFVGIWTPNFIFGILAIYLFIRAANDKPVEVPSLRDILNKIARMAGGFRS
ncbi:MAG: LptF/LptG family permease, partial [Deltaproteobacteria bacterium]|nr:LptF/LptG family permease [Deltaproteobacteria bacterium]